MSHLRNHRNSGIIPMASGAAAAALKARAAAWDVPLVETAEALSLFVWGCELRLVPGGNDVRIELAAPEARLIGSLQDSATELFAEAGLEVRWDRVDAGALAPGLSLMRVLSVTQQSPGFVRVRLTGPDAARYGRPARMRCTGRSIPWQTKGTTGWISTSSAMPAARPATGRCPARKAARSASSGPAADGARTRNACTCSAMKPRCRP
nr:hypothetical protein [Paracoccus everestensis]